MRTALTHFSSSFSVYSCINLFISHNGHDSLQCGPQSNPCLDISYTVNVRALPEDAINLEMDRNPYIIEETIDVKQSISLAGYRGTPTIKSRKIHSLFQYSQAELPVNVTISLENLFFSGVGAVGQIKGAYNHEFAIKIKNCRFENVSDTVICFAGYMKEPSGDLKINISNSSFYRCPYVVYVRRNLRNLSIDISGSTIRGFIGGYGDGVNIYNDVNFQKFRCNIVETIFTNLLFSIYIHFCSTGTIPFHKNTFTGNNPSSMARYDSNSESIISVSEGKSVISITKSNFIKNFLPIYLHSKSSVHVENCQFLDNHYTAYLQWDATTTFVNCCFQKNQGGAIFSGSESTCICKCCLFKDNTPVATSLMTKASIYQMNTAKDLQLINSTILIGRNTPKNRYRSDVLQIDSQRWNVLKDTLIDAPEGFESYPPQRSLISGDNLGMDNVIIRCPLGWNISLDVTVDSLSPSRYHHLTVTCSSCPPKFYSTYKGNVLFSKKITRGYFTTQLQCFRCPYGGNCSNGVVKAQSNFWGFQKGTFGEVEFVRCPIGYCCQGDQCKGYNSCNNNREGILCGRCKHGYSEDLLTSNCIQNAECNKVWFWGIFVLAGMAYVTFFMYMKEILTYLGRILNLKKTFQFRSGKNNELHTLLIQGDDHHAGRQVQNYISDNSGNTERNEESFYSGFIKVVFLFYQIQDLFIFSSSLLTQPHMNEIWWASRELTSSIFNMKVGARNLVHGFYLCAFTGQQPVSKVLLKLLFIIYIVCVFAVTGFLTELYKLRKKSPENQQTVTPLQIRIISSLLQTFLLGYSVLTVSTMTLLQCKPIYGFGRVLYIDGNISCFTTWQFILFVVLALWIALFPLSIYLSSRGLTKGEVSFKSFFLALAFPLGFIFQSIFVYYRQRKQILSNNTIPSDITSDTDEPDCHQEGYPEHIKAIIGLLQGPFRKTADSSTGKLAPLHWEAVLILRRLLLICVYTFVFNPVIQLYVMLFLLCLFLLHHQFVMPFSSRTLNMAESISLILLCLLCSMSIPPAYN